MVNEEKNISYIQYSDSVDQWTIPDSYVTNEEFTKEDKVQEINDGKKLTIKDEQMEIDKLKEIIQWAKQFYQCPFQLLSLLPRWSV